MLSTDFTDFTDFWLRIGVVRARVSASVKSGKSVDNKKSLVAQRANSSVLFYILMNRMFTDVCYASVLKLTTD